MDVRQLSALVAIADHGSFSSAARALFTVQSNVSAHVSKLEGELGVVLVDRTRSELTDEGRKVVERARRVLRELDDISSEMASRGETVHGDSRLGAIGTTARWLMPALLEVLSARHPKLRVTVFEGGSSTLVPRVIAGQLDAAVVHLPVAEPDIEVEPLFAEDLLLLVSIDHPLAGCAQIGLAELAREPLLLPPMGTAFRRILDRAATSVGATLEARAEIDGVRLLASLALDGFGAAIVPASAVSRWVHGGFHRVEVPELPRRVVGWVQRRRPAPSAPTRAAVEALREVVLHTGAAQPGLYVGTDAFPLTRGV